MILNQDICGDRIDLMTFTEQDISTNYLQWISNNEINQYLEVRFTEYSKDLAREYVNQSNRSAHIYFLKIVTKEKELIGTCTVNHNQNHKTAEIGLMIGDPTYHNRGFGSEVIRLLKTFCCDSLGVRKINAGIYAPNMGSLRAFLKCGFFIECKLASQVLLGGRPEDLYRLAYFCQPENNIFEENKNVIIEH